MAEDFWREGMIADWSKCPDSDETEGVYLIVNVRSDGKTCCLIDFRGLSRWGWYGNVSYDRGGHDVAAIIREPTDEELVFITKNMLLHGDKRD